MMDARGRKGKRSVEGKEVTGYAIAVLTNTWPLMSTANGPMAMKTRCCSSPTSWIAGNGRMSHARLV